MKNIMKSLALVAVAAMSFVSCSNNFEDVNVSDKTFQLTISSEKPALENDSRTEFSNGSVIWNSGDQIRACYYHSSGAWSNYYASTENSVSADGVKATFSGFTAFPAQSAEGTYTFYAGYPKNAIGGIQQSDAPTAGELPVVLPTEQTMPKAGTFDANADIMLGVAPDVVAAPVTEISVMWNRLVAHGCVTLKNLAAEEGEIVKHVTFTAPKDVKLTGTNSVSFVDEGFVGDFDNNTVTVNLPANTAAKVAELPVWFCSAPATIASGKNLTVTVETTRGIYTRTINANANGIKFLQNRYNTLGINMADATFTAHAVSANVFQKITSMEELTTGEYVLAGFYENAYYPMSNTFASKITATNTVVVSEGAITENDADGCVVTLSVKTGGVSIYNGSKYLVRNSSSGTNLESSSTEGFWTVTCDDAFTFASATVSSRGLLWYNDGGGKFGGYALSNLTSNDASKYSKIYLFKKTVNDPNAPSLSVAQTIVELENTECEGTVVVNSKNIATINAESNADWLLAEIDKDGNLYYIAGANEGVARTATVTLSAEGVADVVVTFNQAANPSALPGTGEGTKASPYDVTRARAIIDAANGTTVSGVYAKGIVTTDEISFSSQYGNSDYFISVDGTTTNKLKVFRGKYLENVAFTSANQLHAGDEVVIYGDLILYSGSIYEFAANNYIVSLNCGHAAGSTDQTVTFTSKPTTVTVGKTVTVTATANTTVTYSSSNTAVAKVDANTGVVTGVKEGTVTITATAAAEGVYKQATASYSLTVEAAQSGGGEEVTVDFTNVTATFANSKLTWTSNGVTFVQTKAGSSSTNVNSDYNKGSNMRLYQGHTLTFSSEYEITKVEIKTSGKYYGKTASVNVGTLNNPKTDNCTITWTGSSKNFIITNGTGSGGEQIRSVSIKVTYKK